MNCGVRITYRLNKDPNVKIQVNFKMKEYLAFRMVWSGCTCGATGCLGGPLHTQLKESEYHACPLAVVGVYIGPGI